MDENRSSPPQLLQVSKARIARSMARILSPVHAKRSTPNGTATKSWHAKNKAEKSEIVGYIEVCFFAFIFILIFSAMARAGDHQNLHPASKTTVPSKWTKPATD